MGLRLEELDVYKLAMEIGDLVYSAVGDWSYFDKNTLGKQVVRSADSIALNVSEGYGRFYYKENKMFNYYARGSAKETYTAVCKARKRNLLTQQEFDLILSKLDLYSRLSFYYINSIGTSKK